MSKFLPSLKALILLVNLALNRLERVQPWTSCCKAGIPISYIGKCVSNPYFSAEGKELSTAKAEKAKGLYSFKNQGDQ
jgi:hypothetical protein